MDKLRYLITLFNNNKKGTNYITDITFILLVCFCSFLIWYLAIGYALIDQPFIWDDLHQIRSYNLQEILNAWVGTFDPDNVETPGYRPIYVLFYHFLGHIFKENTFYLRIFIFLMSLSLIVLANISLLKIGFTRIGLAIFSVLIIFSKIFATLVSFMSLSSYIFCYISAFISLIFFLFWLENGRFKNYFLSFSFAFICIFTREELYTLPGFIFLFSLCLQKKIHRKIKKIFYGCIPIVLLVLLHMFLRKIFVIDAEQFKLNYYSTILESNFFYGGDMISFVNLIKAFKASFLPMGYFSTRYSDMYQISISVFWISLVLLISILNFINRKRVFLNLFRIIIFILLAALLSLPNLAFPRPTGIFLASVFALGTFCLLINNLFNLIFYNKLQFLKKVFYMSSIFLLICTGVIGGYIRSNQHVNSMNLYSVYIVNYDSIFVYQYPKDGFKLTIPEKRLKKKLEHLASLNIKMDSLQRFPDWLEPFYMDEYKKFSDKILFPKYDPLSF
jgi:hypothetical protein